MVLYLRACLHGRSKLNSHESPSRSFPLAGALAERERWRACRCTNGWK